MPEQQTINPSGAAILRPIPGRPPQPPSPDVAAEQGPAHTKAEFARDFGKATRRAERPGQESSRT